MLLTEFAFIGSITRNIVLESSKCEMNYFYSKVASVCLICFEAPKKLPRFWFLLLFIAAVSVHDAALVVVNSQNIVEVERNPVGRWLIETNDGNVWPFVTIKLFATWIVCAIVLSIYQQSRRIGFTVASGLATFQAMLLVYLSC